MKVPDARGSSPSPWILQWADLVVPAAAVLDVAAGNGRHADFFAKRGHKVVALDLDVSRLPVHPNIEAIEVDLEDGREWPVSGRRFGAVVVTNYLYRPLVPALVDVVEPGGILLYETFMVGHERFGKPSRPDFLLMDGELLELARRRLSVVAYEARPISAPRMAMVQRIAARRL